MELSEEKLASPAAALIKTTLVDFPGRVACSIFLHGCNLRCPYCYNRDLVLTPRPDATLASANEIIAHLENRKKVLTGFVISGGEALLNPLTSYLIKKAKNAGYKVKLDTNGTLPDLLEKLIENPETRPDFIAMDIKTSPQKYASLLSQNKNENYPELLNRSIKLISAYQPECREFRTVLVPTIVSESDIKEIAQILPSDASWQFARFRNENCLDPKYNSILPYLDTEIEKLVNTAKQFIAGAALR